MKIKRSCVTKSALSVILTLCMLLSCLYVGFIPTDAAVVSDSGAVAASAEGENVGYYWSGGTYYMKGTFNNWGELSGTNNSGDTQQHYYYIYANGSSTDADITFKFKEENGSGNDSWFGAGDTNSIGTTGKQIYENGGENIHLNRKNLGTTDTTWYKLKIWFEHKSNCYCWYEKDTTKTELTPTITTKKGSTSTSQFTAGDTVSLSTSTTNNFGTVTYSYEYKKGSGSYQSISGTSFVPTSAGTYTVRVTANDGAVVQGTNSETARTATATKEITVSAAETTYSVSVVSEDTNKGTVASSSVTAGNTAVTIPTATPKYGYKFKQWVATSPASIVANATSATAATVKATGAGGKVTAQFEPDTSMNLYIAGRFHVRQSSGSTTWINSFDSGDWSTTGDDNIKFTYDSGTTYKVETYASVGELSTQISNIDPYFFVYDTDAQKGWHPTANVSLNDTTTSASMTTDTGTFNVRFNDADNTDAPVTIYFNVASKELSYDVPTYYTVTCDTATGGTVTADAARQKEGQTVTLTVTPDDGYTIGTVTVKDASNNNVSVTGTGNTRTFVMPASAVTVSATFTETTHTVYVRKRYYQSNGTTLISTETTNTQTLTGVGIATAKQVNAAPTVTDYTFYKFTLPTGVTLKSGSLTTSAAITVNATVDNAVIYIDYKETMHTLTLVNNPTAGGTIKKSGTSTAITTISVGNVTGVTLVATPNNGYQFSSWTKSSNAVTIGNTANASTTFKTNDDATVTANYTAVEYTISATGSPAAGASTLITTDTSGNSKTGGTINELFEIRITVNAAAGYALADTPITFQTGTGYAAPTLQSGYPTTSGNTVTYRYKLNAGSAVATVNFKAATPTISDVQIKNTSFSFAAYGNPTVNYYLQPTEVKATTDSFATLGYNNTRENQTGTSGTAVTLTQPSINLNAEDATATYVLTITATNAPAGVDPVYTTKTYNIQVQFNDAQKAHFRLMKLLERCIGNPDSSYFKEGAPISAYSTAYITASGYIGGGYPAYNATSASDTAAAEERYNTFKTAYDNLMKFAKTTTVYVLTKYVNNAEQPVNLKVFSNGNATAWNHFKMYAPYGNDRDKITDEYYHTAYCGVFQKNSSNYYLYSFTYAGHISFNVWRGSSPTDETMDNHEKLTDNVTPGNEFISYYVNIYNTNAGTPATPTCTAYADFDHTIATGKKFIEIGDTKTAAEIKTLFNITPVSSMISAPGITVTNTAFTIEGPVDKGLHTTPTDLTVTNFTATTQGRYIVKYTTTFGKDANNQDITRTKEMTLYVAFDDVTIYVDMNDNIGTPILNFKYKQKNEVPVTAGTTGATDAYLPYEMDLVTGSESVYKCTVKTSKLRDDYKLAFGENTPLNISYITVERTNIGESSGGFNILSEARITGEIWFKANSTHLTTFQTISCGSVTKSFAAVSTDGTLLSSAVELLHGTGINTDIDEVYKAQYAGMYKLENTTAPMNNFHYVLNAAVKQEVKSGETATYAFEKWVKVSTAKVTYTTNDSTGVTTVAYSDGTDYSSAAGLTFTKADDYGDGENDVTYIALYRLVASGQPVRVEITYKFKDYDTSDGNYVFDRTKDENDRIAKTVDASYTKTVLLSNTDFNTVKSSVATIAENRAPYIKSNYFDYAFKAGSAQIVSELPDESKLVVTAELRETPHTYTIILKNGSTVVDTPTGYYQETVALGSAGVSNPVWKIASGSTDVVLGSGDTGSTFTARFAAVNDGDTQVIKVVEGTATAADHKSVVSDAYTEVYYTDSGTEMLRHNFYIIDYCTEGELKGGGVLFATTDGTNYRQANAATVLASTTSREEFISGILNNDFDTEYKAQTINNVGFRYKPFKSSEDVYRYSDNLKAYITMYEGTNVNSDSYSGQTLRLFSFMVYDNNGTKVIVPSDGYAEVNRYQPQN